MKTRSKKRGLIGLSEKKEVEEGPPTEGAPAAAILARLP